MEKSLSYTYLEFFAYVHIMQNLLLRTRPRILGEFVIQ